MKTCILCLRAVVVRSTMLGTFWDIFGKNRGKILVPFILNVFLLLFYSVARFFAALETGFSSYECDCQFLQSARPVGSKGNYAATVFVMNYFSRDILRLVSA